MNTDAAQSRIGGGNGVTQSSRRESVQVWAYLVDVGMPREMPESLSYGGESFSGEIAGTERDATSRLGRHASRYQPNVQSISGSNR